MKKAILLVSILLLFGNLPAQKIIYELPPKVTDYLSKYLSEKESAVEDSTLSIYLEKINGLYHLEVIEASFSKRITETIISNTARFVKVKDVYLPLVTEEDILFANFGETPPRKEGGPKGRVQILLIIDYFLIVKEIFTNSQNEKNSFIHVSAAPV